MRGFHFLLYHDHMIKTHFVNFFYISRLMHAICEDVYALALALISWRLWSNMDTTDCSVLYCIVLWS